MIGSTSSTAGGRATEAGMSFQAMVGTWLAAHLVTAMPVGQRFGLAIELRPVELRFETGDALDDLVVRLTDGGMIYAQCKTAIVRYPRSSPGARQRGRAHWPQ